MFILRIKRFFASNKYFWKFRHVFQNKIFINSYGTVPKKHFSSVFQNIQIKSVLDFGCGTGDKIVHFINNGAEFAYGIDINPAAILTAENKLKKLNVHYELCEEVDYNHMNKFLNNFKIKKFDLVVLDRVLYILSNNDLFKLLNIFSKISNYIYIDDFFLVDEGEGGNNLCRKNIKGYVHTNFNQVLKIFLFKIIYASKTPYPKVKFANAQTALYEKS